MRLRFSTLAARAADLFTHRAQTQDGFNSACQKSIELLAEKVDELLFEKEQMDRRLADLEMKSSDGSSVQTHGNGPIPLPKHTPEQRDYLRALEGTIVQPGDPLLEKRIG